MTLSQQDNPMKMPLVHEKDDGIRPAGKTDECIFCRQKVGSEHLADCVCVTKRVKLRVTIEYEVDVPHHWDKNLIEFQRNDGSWCVDNMLEELAEIAEAEGCLCGRVNFKFLQFVDETPKRKIRE